jgi:hypothetical protein
VSKSEVMLPSPSQEAATAQITFIRVVSGLSNLE